MTREQKAMAAYGSVLAVGLLLLWRWSVPGGLLLLVLGLAAVTAALRLTNPHRFGPPAQPAPGPGARPAPRQARPYFGQDQGDQRAELARRRQAAAARTQQRQDGRPPR